MKSAQRKKWRLVEIQFTKNIGPPSGKRKPRIPKETKRHLPGLLSAMRKLQVCSLSLSFAFPESSFNFTKKAKPYSLFQYPQTLSLSLSLFSRTLIFFFKNIQSLQSRLQVCSLIQSFSNSRFTYLFLALLYIIEFLKFLNFFWKIRFESIFVCVCVYGERYGFGGVRVVISGSVGSQARVRLRNEGAIRDLRVLGSDPVQEDPEWGCGDQ